ncbi:MAG: trypsin-like peptidase domain-containing protein [Opitutaceae bacterium]
MLKESHSPSITHPGRTALVGLIILTAGFLTGCQTADVSKSTSGVDAGFANLLDSVVRIDVRELDFDSGSKRFVSGVGSGVILSEDGLVLTNAHVASTRAVEISVTLANLERVNATLIGWDHWTDLALLRIDMDEVAKRKLHFAHAEFGDSDLLRPGQIVFAVGTPHGLTRTVTKGIISNTDRYFETSNGINGYETGYFNTWLQTDAAINPGNSGGPLVTENGRVVGINSRTYMGADNLGFAIPSSTARRVVAELVEHGEVVRSYIGLIPGSLRDLESFYNLEINTGMLVNSVDPGSPASSAGLRPGDVILAIDGKKVDGRFPEQLPPIQNQIASYPVGSTIKLTAKRGATERVFEVTSERLESRVGEEWAFEGWGLSVREVSRAFARENRLAREGGVLVIGTQSAYPAEKAGINRGDIITKINDQTIDGLEEMRGVYGQFDENPQTMLFETLRNQSVSFFVLKP